MENLGQFLDYIARTNLFNFVIFASIIVLLIKQIKVNDKLEEAKTAVEESIEESKNIKAESESRLNTVQESFSRIEEEIEAILKKSEENSERVGKKILADAEKSALVIHENTAKALENSRLLLRNELIRRASLASVAVAKEQILIELDRNPDLHDKLIDESIDSIEGSSL